MPSAGDIENYDWSHGLSVCIANMTIMGCQLTALRHRYSDAGARGDKEE